MSLAGLCERMRKVIYTSILRTTVFKGCTGGFFKSRRSIRFACPC